MKAIMIFVSIVVAVACATALFVLPMQIYFIAFDFFCLGWCCAMTYSAVRYG